MQKIKERIDDLIKLCDGINCNLYYNSMVFEVKNLVVEIAGESSKIYGDFKSVQNSEESDCDKCNLLIGILNALKNHIDLSSKNKKYQIFISSTYKDLIDYRKAVSDEIYFEGHIPAGMEDFTACGERLDSYIKKVIEKSDYYLLIIGQRYGTEYIENVSYTQMEYQHAKEKGLRIIPFIYVGEQTLSESDIAVNGEKLQIFKDEIARNHAPQYFKSIEELTKKANKALEAEFKNYPQKGWIRL